MCDVHQSITPEELLHCSTPDELLPKSSSQHSWMINSQITSTTSVQECNPRSSSLRSQNNFKFNEINKKKH
jgi:hypothetical protein